MILHNYMQFNFVRDDYNRVKIGCVRDSAKRLKELQCGAADPLALIRTVPGGRKTEAWFHKRFADRRYRSEWFWFCQELLTEEAPFEGAFTPAKIEPSFATITDKIEDAERLGLLIPTAREYFAPLLLKEAAPPGRRFEHAIASAFSSAKDGNPKGEAREK